MRNTLSRVAPKNNFGAAVRRALLILSVFACGMAGARPITVDSLEALMPYLKQDQVEVKLAPGIYTVSAKDAAAGKFGVHGFQKKSIAVFLFEGSDSTYDFTDVTIKVETEVYRSLGKFDVYIVQIMGNNNVLKNLSLHDVGSVDDAPKVRAVNVVMDGRNNRIEGFDMIVMGAYPYGYGELFGKGGGSTIKHRKHSAFLIRGLQNHALNCHIDQQSYGHAFFMQAADQPVIEGCSVVGRMRNTNDILAEKGSGSEADRLDFMTHWGYRIPPDYMISLCEAGIRAYNGGTTWINGEVIERATMKPTVLNCTVKNVRAGVTLSQAKGRQVVRGTTLLGCSRAFAISDGEISDCYADLQYGPALAIDGKSTKIEITLLPHEGETVNASGQVAYITGSQHRIVLRSEIRDASKDYVIQLGGKLRLVSTLADKKDSSAQKIQLNNLSGFPVILEPTAKNCVVNSGGPVRDDGKGNKVSRVR